MSINCKISVTADTAIPAVARIIARTAPARLANVCRTPLVSFVRRHLAANGRNKRGWPSTGFWERASRSVQSTASDRGVLILVNQVGVRQRYYGGRITAVNRAMLTIPISPLSYGKTAREFPGSFILRTPKGAWIVQYATKNVFTKAQTTTIRGGRMNRRAVGATFNFLFKLVQSVDQAGDPSVMPSDDEMTAVAWTAITKELGASWEK